MLHGAEDDVDDEADGNPQVEEGVGDDGVELPFEPTPAAATVPGEEEPSRGGAAPGTRGQRPRLCKRWKVDVQQHKDG